MNKKSLMGGILFSTNSAGNVSIIFVVTSCECEELHLPMTFHSISVSFLIKHEIQVFRNSM